MSSSERFLRGAYRNQQLRKSEFHRNKSGDFDTDYVLLNHQIKTKMNLSNIKALILDMDGVLWHDTAPIGNLPAIFTRIQERGLKVAMATNNASRTVDEFLEKFARFGVTLEPEPTIVR